jgi:hypothetical protein
MLARIRLENRQTTSFRKRNTSHEVFADATQPPFQRLKDIIEINSSARSLVSLVEAVHDESVALTKTVERLQTATPGSSGLPIFPQVAP